MECPLCFKIYDKFTTVAFKLPCSHLICSQCLDLMQKMNNITCPLCLTKNIDIKDLNKCRTVENILLAKQDPPFQNEEVQESISFIVKNLRGFMVELTLKNTDKILKIKEYFEQTEKLPKNSQWLLYLGRSLSDDQTIQESKIRNQDIIYLVTRSFGG